MLVTAAAPPLVLTWPLARREEYLFLVLGGQVDVEGSL